MSNPVTQDRLVDLAICPVCAMQIRAKAEIEVQPTLGEVKADGTVAVNVTTRMTRFNVSHICAGGPVDVDDAEATS